MICVRDKRGRRCGEVVVVVQECGLLPGMREEDNEELRTEDRRDGYRLYLSEPSTVLPRHPSPIGFTPSVPFYQSVALTELDLDGEIPCTSLNLFPERGDGRNT